MSIEQQHSPAHGPPPTVDRGHEPYQTNVTAVILLAGAVAAALLVTLLVGLGLYAWFGHRERQADVPPPPVAAWRTPPPPPQLQAYPQRDLNALRQREHELLSTYGWVDRSQGIVRLPIDRAIELTVQPPQPQPEPLPLQP